MREDLIDRLQVKTVTFDETKWVLVPREPTEAMLVKFEADAGSKITDGKVYARGVWTAMLAAAMQEQEVNI